MVKQKEMIAEHFDRLPAKETARRWSTPSCPGNLTELLLAFDVLPVYPEINALQSAMRKKSGDFIAEAERARPLRGRVHLREVRHRHEAQGQHRPHRGSRCPSPICCCCRTRAASPS
jgi:hypothetical protein